MFGVNIGWNGAVEALTTNSMYQPFGHVMTSCHNICYLCKLRMRKKNYTRPNNEYKGVHEFLAICVVVVIHTIDVIIV